MKMEKTIILTKSNKPYIYLMGSAVFAFLTLGMFYEGRKIIGAIFGLFSAGLVAAASSVKNPKARLNGTILSIEEINGATSEWDLRKIHAWEVLSDLDFDMHPKNSVDNPGISMEFQNGGRVIARCYFDRHLQKDLVEFCVQEKSKQSKREIGIFAGMYRPFEKEIIDMLNR